MQRAWNYVAKSVHTFGTRQIALSAVNHESNLTLLDVDDKTGIATLSMNHPPINALNRALFKAIQKNLEELRADKVRGLILTSTLRSVFSAGLDLKEVYKADREVVRELYCSMQDVGYLLNTFHAPTVALINGHAPAGGCVLSLTCEYRIMLPNFTIGLNEAVLGMVVPRWIMDLLLEAVSRREAELALTKGKIFLSEQALKAGLVDEIVKDKQTGLERCNAFFKEFAQVNPLARVETKNQFRYNDLKLNKIKDLDWFVGLLMQPNVQENIGTYLESLKKRQ